MRMTTLSRQIRAGERWQIVVDIGLGRHLAIEIKRRLHTGFDFDHRPHIVRTRSSRDTRRAASDRGDQPRRAQRGRYQIQARRRSGGPSGSRSTPGGPADVGLAGIPDRIEPRSAILSAERLEQRLPKARLSQKEPGRDDPHRARGRNRLDKAQSPRRAPAPPRRRSALRLVHPQGLRMEPPVGRPDKRPPARGAITALMCWLASAAGGGTRQLQSRDAI